MENGLKAPVLLVCFNRPSQTRRILDVLTRVKPRRLYVSIDGARKGVASDVVAQTEILKLVEAPAWPCELTIQRYPENVGCKAAVSGAITWFFQQVEEGIIVEDDCLPAEDFFLFSEFALEKYRNDPRIGCINGNHVPGCAVPRELTYYYTVFPNIWGWATWRRVWEDYDVRMVGWSEDRRTGNLLRQLLPGRYFGLRSEWARSLDDAWSGRTETWCYQFNYLFWRKGYMAIQPTRNLISNIGFGEEATHTKDDGGEGRSAQPIERLELPYVVPGSVQRYYVQEERWVYDWKLLIKAVLGEKSRSPLLQAANRIRKKAIKALKRAHQP